MTQLAGALRTLLDADSVFDGEDVLKQFAYDGWPVAAKWRNQGKAPLKPEVVVRPAREEQIPKLLRWANEHGVALTPWGAGSSVTGAPLPLTGGITLDLSLLDRTLEINERNLTVTVQTGKMGQMLEAELNRHGYTLNHSPQSLDRSTVGGWLSTRATGQFSSKWGGIENLLVGFDVVLADGSTAHFQTGPRMAVGPDLRHVFVGAEGTMGVITQVTLQMFRQSAHRIFQTLAFANLDDGVAVMREVMQRGLKPFLLRFYNVVESRHAMKDPGFNQCAMFIGFEGEQGIAEAEYRVAKAIWDGYGAQELGPVAVEKWMERRFDFSTVENILKTPGGLAETIEIAHFWDGIEETYQRLAQELAPYADEVLAHFSHAYPQGTSLYLILLGQCADDAEAEAALLKVWQTAMTVCLETGAALSHHHGVGVARKDFVRSALGSSMPVLERVKQVLDPQNILSPGKLGLELSRREDER
ncbi:MAG: FAD-binding oxidoreductase [Anaerolineae bacterium]|nr:FAD-binding oxidoreductase [Anaerolineae bacterium]